MIVENHRIAHRNVASKYYRFYPDEIELAVQDFQSILEKHDYHPDGRMLFSILSDPTSEIMSAEIFLPIWENTFTIQEQEEIKFHSYLSISPMIMTRVTDDFNEQSQVQFWELMNYINQNSFQQNTPVFAEYKTTHSGSIFLEMSVGVKRLK
ncbi:DUF5085 family protein [Gracilibacillus kekensis]|uniref:Uncharacterized protein n=1 Tax=Gracilibacillus kekensis TaxID=1027249 RepID=A0A1M7JNR6_9BACI|nr:DUF5085 family protein [Gracilibacillus kekensis]SHM54740.1 protein of unknown function [Gracilibacillus kekensis]